MIAALAEKPDDFADAYEYLRMLWLPGEVREVRIPKYNEWGQTAAGWFDDPDEMAQSARTWDGRANVYVTLNPVETALLARANRRIAPRASATTADSDIVQRRWLPIDIDPVRPSGISSTEGELMAACEVFDALTAFLRAQGWANPIMAMSGNGYNALYPIDLPNDTEATELVRGVLKALAARFDSAGAHVDTTVSNAARIIGLVGFMKVKGDETEDRPHRRSALEAVPSTLGTVSMEQLEAVANLQSRAEPAPAPHSPRHRPGRALVTLLEGAGIEFRTQSADAAGITWYHLKQCPFHDDGKPFECGVGQKLPDGAFAGHCFHPEGAGKGWKDFRDALGLGKVRPPTATATEDDRELPEIVVSGKHLHEIAEAAWAAVALANRPPFLFHHGGGIAEVRRDESGAAHIHHLDEAALRGRLDRLARWFRLVIRGGNESWVPTPPPKIVLEDMLAYPGGIPALRTITGTPTFSSDGMIDGTVGYQMSSGMYYERTGRAVAPVPDTPSGEDLSRAVAQLRDEWLGQFPFADAASMANAIAMPLTALTRHLVADCTPLFAVDAPEAGTGKGFLVGSVGIIVNGAPPAVTTQPRDGDEMRKRITSLLRQGSQTVLIDNIKHKLDSPELAAVLTSTVWEDRLLSTNQMLRLPNQALWMATGNNLQLDGDVARRSVWVRLDARTDRPWERSGWKHDPFLQWVREARSELIWALLVIVRNWFVCGRPRWSGKPMGTFESWCRVIGGILEAANVDGFLSNREELYRRTDSDSEEWRAFLPAWHREFSTEPVGVSDLFPLVQTTDHLASVFRSARSDASERSLKTRLGTALRAKVDQRFGDLSIRAAGSDSHSKGAMYRLEVAEPPPVEDQGSAQVPHDFDPSVDSFAEPPEPAEPFSYLRTEECKSTRVTHSGRGGTKKVPMVPQVPLSDSKTGAKPAEPGAEPQSNGGKVPQDGRVAVCLACGASDWFFEVDSKSCAQCGARMPYPRGER